MLDPIASPISLSPAQPALAGLASSSSPVDDSAAATLALKALGLQAAPTGPSFASTLQSRLRLTALNKLALPPKAPAVDIAAADSASSAERPDLITEALSVTNSNDIKSEGKTLPDHDVITTENASDPSNAAAAPSTDTTSATPTFTLNTVSATASTTITPIIAKDTAAPALSPKPPASTENMLGTRATTAVANRNNEVPTTAPAIVAGAAEINAPAAAIADKQRDGNWFGELLGNRVNAASQNMPQAVTMAMPARIVATPVSSRDWSGDVGNQLTWMVSQRESSANLVLNPPEMGRIEVSITLNGDQASASFVSSNPDVRDALQGSLPRLREVLADAGVFLGQADIGAKSFGQQRNGAEKGHKSGDDSVPSSGPSLLGSVNLSPTMSILTSGQGLIDLFA